METKTKLILALIPTIILLVYAIELGIRVLTADGKAEYLIAASVLIIVLLLVDSRFYGNYKKEK